jgi:hypothetical protein
VKLYFLLLHYHFNISQITILNGNENTVKSIKNLFQLVIIYDLPKNSNMELLYASLLCTENEEKGRGILSLCAFGLCCCFLSFFIFSSFLSLPPSFSPSFSLSLSLSLSLSPFLSLLSLSLSLSPPSLLKFTL